MVELLVVIGIISVLATILLLQLGTARTKARDTKRVADINQMRSAIEQYFDDNGTYPPFNAFDVASFTKFISPIPVDPLGPSTCTIYSGTATNRCYGYAWGGAVGAIYTKYQVWAELEAYNRSALTADSDVNAVGGDWTPAGGNGANGAADGSTGCTATSNIDCVFDLGIK